MPGVVEFEDWNGRLVRGAYSRNGVLALARVQDGLIQGTRWPPAAIVQKLYRSNRASAFGADELALLQSDLGYYCDLQSVHSEDAVTWSFFGTLDYSDQTIRVDFLKWFNRQLGFQGSDSTCDLSLWRRVPHPETLDPSGPEIDVLIIGNHTVTALEAKWRSSEDLGQGLGRDKGQMQLRREFLENLGPRIYKDRSVRVVGVGWEPSEGWLTWEDLGRWDNHPYAEEFRRYLRWKTVNSQPAPCRSSRLAKSEYH